MAGGKIAAKVGRAACSHAAEGGVLAAKNAKSAKAMKPSGVAWLGDIPEGWEMRRLKTCFSIVSGSGFKEHLQGRTDGDYPVFKARDIGKADVTLNYSKNWITSDEVETEGFKIIPANSILMPKIGEAMRKNSRAISGVACCVDNNCQGLLPRMVDVKLSYYLLCSIDVRAFDNGGAIPCINNQAFLDFSCPLPPLPEQRAIADYLDEKCGAIDAAIAEAKKGIEEYKAWKKSLIFEAVTGKGNPKRPLQAQGKTHSAKKQPRRMKPSGIPWIGDIPEGWEVSKTLHALCMPITDGPHTTPDLFDDGIPFVSAEAVSCGNGRIDFDHVRGYISEAFYNECCLKYIPQRDDIYMIKSGATTGRVAIVDTDRRFTIWSPLAVFRCNLRRAKPRYVFYYLQSSAYQGQVELAWSFGTQQNIGMRALEELKVVLPSLPEQQAIADYLDEKCAAIDALVAEKEALIADLEAYKKSLIYETVTGKREVA